MLKKLIISIIILVIAFESKAQDPQFTQFYAMPLYLNPAFAGTTIKTRGSLIYRNQWPSIPKAFVTFSGSADHNLDIYNSGIGILFTTDRAGSGGLKSTDVSALYSYQINLPNNWVVRPGLQLGYTIRSVDYTNLTFGDQLDFNASGGIATAETNNFQNLSYIDISSGLLAYNEQYWFGVSSHHLNRPNQSLTDENSPLPIRLTVHGGAKFPLNVRMGKGLANETEKPSISPAFIYKAQGKFDQLDVGFYVNYEPMVFGIWYRGLPIKQSVQGVFNHDALAFLVGFHYRELKIGYSYDLTVSKLGPPSGGAHEISISYEVDYGNKKRKIKRKDMYIPCPKF